MEKTETLEKVEMYQQELFDYLHEELGVIALQSQMHEIETIVLKMHTKKMYSEEDLKHLDWVYDRILNVHKENPNYDYIILQFKSIIEQFKNGHNY